MGFTRYETELSMGVAASDPHRIYCYTNWPYYLTRLDRCEGFKPGDDTTEADGSARMLHGELDISEFGYLWFRKAPGSENADRRFQAERAKLGEVTRSTSAYRPEAGERETNFHTNRDEPYWMTVETDAAIWQRRMNQHPYAVLVSEVEYADGETKLQRFVIPRSLVTIRRNRPQYSEEYREELRARLVSFRN